MTDQSADSHAEEIRSLEEGKSEAIASLFFKHRKSLLAMIRVRLDGRLLGRVDPEDILQEAYLEAARRRMDYLAAPNVPAFIWIRQITTQVLINIHRRHLGVKKRDVRLERRFHQSRGHDASSASLAALLVGDITSPSQFASRRERIDQLRMALDSMDESDREVLVLRHLEELTNEETAQVLDISAHAASKRYLRAIARLRAVLTQFEQE